MATATQSTGKVIQSWASPAYSDSPAASRAGPRSVNSSQRKIAPSRSSKTS